MKLFSSILTSSVWGEDMATRIVWITLLALSDKDGNVRSSPSGLARMANVTPEQCNAALLKFLSPDPESGSDEQEGRRIETIPAGWFIINYAKYRDLQDAETRRAQWRESSRKHRQQKSAERQQPSTRRNKRQPASAPTEAVTEGTTETATTSLAGGEPKRSWLGIYLAKWDEVYGKGSSATLNGQMAKALKPLHDAHGGPEVLRRLSLYLAETEARFANPTTFAQRFAGWGSGAVPERTRRNAAALQRLAETPDAV